MDAFEGVRRSAAELHGKLVEAGADPLAPTALIKAAIAKLGLDLYWLEPGDPALKGSRALFDEQSGTICCENVGDPGERALLIAHEIGHACVHASSTSCETSDIDASRSMEPAPIGLQRVEDYGVRERRELQANVFAREFVFPRALGRRLHVDEGLGALAIAERTGLPKNLVRQQLFDALLLPPIPESEPGDPAPRRSPRRDRSQDRAARHRGSPFQLQAGPGTGKTRTLVKAVLSLLEDGVEPSSVLILTYSSRAAGELAERIASVAKTEATRIWIGTFHAFGLDLMRRYHDKIGLSPKPVLFDKSDAIEVLQELLPTLPLVHYRNLWDPALILRDIVAAISRAKDELTDPARYRSLADEMKRRAVSDEERVAADKCLEVAHVYELYEQALRDHGAVDFGDLVMKPAFLVESDLAVQTEVRLRHRHVLVDEYQDVNRASTRLLKALAGDGKHLWVVGDARQSIYRFRGASSANMAAFVREYAGAIVDQLQVSYRSTKEVVDVVSAIVPHMGASEGMLPLCIEADRGSGPGRPEIRRYETLEDEAAGIAASIRDLEARGVRLRDQAVLCRTNTRLSDIAAALEARGIPVLHLGSLFERDEVRDLLALMSLAVDPFGDGLTRVAAMSLYNLSLQDLHAAAQWLRASGKPIRPALPGMAEAPGLSPEGIAGVARLARDFAGVHPAMSAWELLSTYMLDRTDFVKEKASDESVAGRMRCVAIWQFLNFVREQGPAGSALPIRRVLDRVRQLVLLAEERDLRQVPSAALHMDAVKLMTVHGSKGLEFEAVHIPGLTVSSFPLSYRSQKCPPPAGMVDGSDLSVSEEATRAHENEEQCLFFVAVSRARTHLVIHLCQRMANGNKRNPSRFLAWVQGEIMVEVPDPPSLALPPEAPRPAPIEVKRADGWHVTDGQLASYEKCPRRFFYTHVLGLRGSRKTTAFSQTHDCLYELLGWLAGARLEGEPTLEAAEAAFESIWQERGPIDHGFARDYRELASRLVAALIAAGAGHRFLKSEPIAVDFPSGRVVVEPSEIAELPDGAVILRRVSTGRRSKEEDDKIDYVLYHLAGQARFGERYRVESVHLSSEEAVEVIEITSKRLASQKDKGNSMLENLSAGWFPAKTDAVTCPRCPHFFVCSAIPRGPLMIA